MAAGGMGLENGKTKEILNEVVLWPGTWYIEGHRHAARL